jgi:hypothetical protein
MSLETLKTPRELMKQILFWTSHKDTRRCPKHLLKTKYISFPRRILDEREERFKNFSSPKIQA